MHIDWIPSHVLHAKLSQPFVWSFTPTDSGPLSLVEIVSEGDAIGSFSVGR